MMITFTDDVAPHLERALAYRAQRLHRIYDLHKHDGRPKTWWLILSGLALFWATLAWGISAIS
jgi:hypothetical protein